LSQNLLLLANSIIEIYTDGSCLNNPGPGGWAFVTEYHQEEITRFGSEKESTNNRMEMQAIIEALKWFRETFKARLAEQELHIFSDSNLIIQTMNQGWKKKANTDLWQEIEKLSAWLNIRWVWVKAHSTNIKNNLADKLAREAAEKQL
jgi:ribonuclease HI